MPEGILLQLDNASCGLKFLLEFLRVFLLHTLFDGFGGSVGDRFCFNKADAKRVLDNLDNLDLLSASLLQDNIEGGLRLSLSGTCACGRTCHSHCSCRNAELLLERAQ